MRANEFLIERWTKATVKSYFDNKKQLRFTSRDITVSQPVDGCVLLQYKTIPNLARSFFRVAEYYDGNHYSGKSGQVTLVDFLDQWMDQNGDVDYFKFWDGFNIPDRAFRSWLKSAGKLSTAEQVMVTAVEKASKGMKKFCIIGVGNKDADTVKHEMFHAKYYLDADFKRQADQLFDECRNDPVIKTMAKVLKTKLDYQAHVDEEVAAYLYSGSQLKLVFGVDAKSLVQRFQELDK
jgi:hypothetical protein